MKTRVHIALALSLAVGSVYAAPSPSLALVSSDAAFASAAQSMLAATKRFSTVDVIDVTSSTPTLAQLSNYTDVLAWTNSPPFDGTGLGNVLADFYDLGGKRVTIASFAFANSGGISGRIMSGNYVGLVNANTYAKASGNLVAIVPTDPVFSGITPANVTYYHGSNFANPALVSGATLLATDGAGMNLIARSTNGVMNFNLYPGSGAGAVNGVVDNNADFYNLVANTFDAAGSTGSTTDTTPPTTTATVSPVPNANGWNNSNVAVALSAVDNAGGSGVKQISYTLSGAQSGGTTVTGSTASIAITIEGSTTVTYSSTDNAGNVEAAKTVTVLLDKTGPAVTATVNPLPDSTGWNTAPVTVTFTGTDTLSGIGSCTQPVTLTTNGFGQVVTGTCTDKAGNSTTVSTTVNIRLSAALDPPGPVIQGIPTGKCILWPPNGQMVQVATLSVQAGQAASFSVTASSNQPDSDPADILITGNNLGPRSIQLRAKRSGRGGTRVYTVIATAGDAAGDITVDQFTCTVPHDQRSDEEDIHTDGDRR